MEFYNKEIILNDEEGDEDEEKAQKNAPTDMLVNKRFLKERKIFLWGAVEDSSAKRLTSEIMYLDLVDPGKDITFYVNTPGGSVTAGMALYDTMKLVKSPITVVVTGMAASMGSILLSAPQKGRRLLYPHARVLIHQPLIMGRIQAAAVDINIQAEEMERQREELNEILAKASGQSMAKIKKDTDRDFYLNAQEAIDYGLADKIVDSV